MLLIEAQNIKKSYGDRLILNIENLKVYSEDRIGIVGLNGAGKSTLMNILCKRIQPDEGAVKIYTDYSYISQLEDADQKEINKKIASKFCVSNTWQNSMSGGEKTRYKLAESLSKNKKIIFADEPTSNLDMAGCEDLEKKFQEYYGALIIISHDREFLNTLCTKILEIENGAIKIFSGNYDKYKAQKQNLSERAQFEYEQFEKEKKKLNEAIEETKQKVKTMKKAPSRMGNSEARLHKMGNQKAKANLDKAVKNMRARLEKLEVKEKPVDIEKVKIDMLSTDQIYSKILLSGENINKAFNSKIIFNNAEFQIYNGRKAALLGPNGSGKSTLIKMILSRAEGIKTASTVKIGYFSQTMDILNDNFSIIENVMESSIYDETFARILLSRLLFKNEDIYKKINVLSGGERVKVSFAKIFLQDINLLILDEPTNYLDLYSLEAVEAALKDFDKTVLFVSHDRRFVSSVADSIIAIENHKLVSFSGSYSEYMERKKKKAADTKNDTKDTASKILLLQNRLTEVISRLSMPSRDDNVPELDKEYYKLLGEIKSLKETI